MATQIYKFIVDLWVHGLDRAMKRHRVTRLCSPVCRRFARQVFQKGALDAKGMQAAHFGHRGMIDGGVD